MMATYSPKDVVTLLADDGLVTTDKKVRAFVRTSGVTLACGSGNRYAWDVETFALVCERMRAHASASPASAPHTPDELREALASLEADETEDAKG
jgi:hypothetical protein